MTEEFVQGGECENARRGVMSIEDWRRWRCGMKSYTKFDTASSLPGLPNASPPSAAQPPTALHSWHETTATDAGAVIDILRGRVRRDSYSARTKVIYFQHEPVLDDATRSLLCPYEQAFSRSELYTDCILCRRTITCRVILALHVHLLYQILTGQDTE